MKVAITGGTGTLGQALIARLLADGHGRVVSVSRDEVKGEALYAAHKDAKALRIFIGSVRDRNRMLEAFQGCDTVIHAAALKRINEGVFSPSEFIKTNITGTMNVIHAAADAGVRNVLVVSSDKAVHATNLYGMSKAVAESYAVQSNTYVWPRGTRVACTRYGNVLDSRSSVLEHWRRAQAAGQPLPLTSPAMTRFVLTIRQAVQFILDALERMEGGEICVPQLAAMRLTDLADAFAPGHRTAIIGLRPGGEKLHEVLVSDEEYARLYRWGGTDTLVILPSHRTWSAEPYNVVAAKVTNYVSDGGPFLTVATLKEMLDAH